MKKGQLNNRDSVRLQMEIDEDHNRNRDGPSSISARIPKAGLQRALIRTGL
jgi:hypothetical protein